MDAHVGRRVNWVGLVRSVSAKQNIGEKPVILLNMFLTDDWLGGSSTYCWFSAEQEAELAVLKKGSRIRITGILKDDEPILEDCQFIAVLDNENKQEQDLKGHPKPILRDAMEK